MPFSKLIRDNVPGRDRTLPLRREGGRPSRERVAPRAQATRRGAVKSAKPAAFLHWLKITTITLSATCGSLFGGYHGYQFVTAMGEEFPIRTVRTFGNFTHVQPEHLKAVLGQSLQENFFELDLHETRARVESHPWVHSAFLRKEWPDTLVVNIRERVPMALWGTSQVMSDDFRLFDRGDVSALPVMPELYGADRHAKLMWNRFQTISAMLKPVSLTLDRLVMAERYSWKLMLANGMEIVVDERDWEMKIERFIQFYQKIPEAERTLLARADLRYDNALAVKWKKKDDNPDAA